MGGSGQDEDGGVGATRPFPPLDTEELDAVGATRTFPPESALEPADSLLEVPSSVAIEPVEETRDFPPVGAAASRGEPPILPGARVQRSKARVSFGKPDPEPDQPSALVVVDTPIDAFQASEHLKALGYRVIQAAAGKAALADLQREAPDLVYLDCWFSGMDALSFLRLGERSRPTLAFTTIVCVPDDADEDLLELLTESGVAAVLHRDWTAEQLDDALDRARLPELPDESLGSERSFLELASKLHPDVETLDPITMELPPVEPDAPLDAGTLIDRRYRIVRFLGRGATSTVYAVEDRELGEKVALKLLHRDTDASQTARERFRQEMRICRRLVHPSVVRSFEFGAWEGRLYFTMELLEGEPLRRLLLRNRWEPVPLKLGLGWLASVARGLAEAHKLGVVHRDIKPENLFLLRDSGDLKIMDFGIATAGPGTGPREVEGVVLGTPAYLSPEQVRGETRITPASDVFSLGIVAWEMFGGRHPFYRKSQVDLMWALVHDDAPKLRTAHRKAPRKLETLLDRMLQKVPRRRPKTAAEVADEFDRLLGR